MTPIAIQRLDHLVLTVASIPTSTDFYRRVLNLEVHEKDGRWSLRFGQQMINLQQVNLTREPKAEHPTPGSADFCFITATAPSDTIAHLEEMGVSVLLGPVARPGALGPMTSVYFRDPDQNLLEIACYTAPHP